MNVNENDDKLKSGHPDYHVPVLYNEAIEALNIKQDGVYVDCTFGGGGHSKGILEKLNDTGRLIAFDQDIDAQQNLFNDERIIFVPHNFRHLQRFLRLHKYPKVNGVLADLGVSSFQFNEAERGFSTRFEGPLDMRMDRRTTKNASAILMQYDEKELHRQLYLKNLSTINVNEFVDKRVVIKGCGETPIGDYVYMELTKILRPVAKSIMYGEPCSTVPIFKRK